MGRTKYFYISEVSEEPSQFSRRPKDHYPLQKKYLLAILKKINLTVTLLLTYSCF